jgi:hypothetical protein
MSDFCVFEVMDKPLFAFGTSGKYVCNYISTFLQHTSHTIRLSGQSVQIIREIFLQEERKHLIEENLFQAMRTPLLKHSFLEVYRTLEFLFVIPRASALMRKLESTGVRISFNVVDFARHCYKELGWKRVERDAIERLFREYATVNIAAFIELSNNATIFKDERLHANAEAKELVDAIGKISDKFYNLRNQVTHQFWPDEEDACTDGEWRVIIEFTLRCVSHFYGQYLRKSVA